MKRPTHIQSIPLILADNDSLQYGELPPEIRELFMGMAVYNTGIISVAFKQPVIMQNISVAGRKLFWKVPPLPEVLIGPGTRIEFDFKPIWDQTSE